MICFIQNRDDGGPGNSGGLSQRARGCFSLSPFRSGQYLFITGCLVTADEMAMKLLVVWRNLTMEHWVKVRFNRLGLTDTCGYEPGLMIRSTERSSA